jgi:hypothetical protein
MLIKRIGEIRVKSEAGKGGNFKIYLATVKRTGKWYKQ